MSCICVIGGANIDICGSSIGPLRSFDSNPGMISVSYGGVGRNIAQICALLRKNTRFVTCFSSDSYGQMMKADCEMLGMDTSGSVTIEGLPSSMYIAILDHNRDMKVGMSDMRILRCMDSAMLEPVLKSLNSDDIIIIDANLDMSCIQYVLANAPCHVAADPVSTSKAGRLRNVLGQLSIFKPNQFEAKELTGISIENEEDARRSLDWFLQAGVKEVIISMAERGLLLGTEHEKLWLTHRRISLENATGGGDTLLGAYVAARLEHQSPDQAIRYGISASVTAIEQDAVKRRSLSPEMIEKSLDMMDIKEKKL